MPFVYTIDQSTVRQITHSPTGMVGKHMHKMGRRLVMLAKRDVGVDTGELRRSIYYRVTVGASGLVLDVGSNDQIALMHHEGTRPHIIVPNARRVLRFRQGGTMVFAQEVRHPGTKPNEYLSRHLARVVLTS